MPPELAPSKFLQVPVRISVKNYGSLAYTPIEELQIQRRSRTIRRPRNIRGARRLSYSAHLADHGADMHSCRP